MQYCPSGLSACRVSRSDVGGYEVTSSSCRGARFANSSQCIDTKEELESCGGCLWGVFGSKSHDQLSFGVE
jgi:hypothetical protein